MKSIANRGIYFILSLVCISHFSCADATAASSSAATPSTDATASADAAANTSPRSESSAAPKDGSDPAAENKEAWTLDINEDHTCKMSCIDPHTDCAESQKLIDTMRIIYTAYAKADFKTAGDYLAENCTTFDGGSRRLISGKEAVMEDLKKKVMLYRDSHDAPLVSYTIDHPYAKVSGDLGIVTFVAYKQFGGNHPQRFESHCTDIFVKEDGKWKKMHYRSNWKKVSS